MSIEITGNSASTEASAQPIIVDLGKKSRKRVKKLRKGKQGKLMDKVMEVLGEMKEAGAMPASAQPVVIVVRERGRKAKYGKLWGMG